MGPVTLSPVVEDVGWFSVVDASAVGTVRRAAMRLADRMGYDEGRAGHIGIVATEMATNLVRHASEGAMLLRVVRIAGLGGVEVVALDRGPGIADLAEALRDGQSSAGTLGVGLGAIQRLATQWDVHSIVGRGTVLTATLWPAGTTAGDTPASGLTRPIPGEEQCGDGWAIRTDDGSLQVMLSDGLGHGPLAALATERAVTAFLDGPRRLPAEVLRRLHREIGGTRGAAIAVADFAVDASSLRYAGIGNVAGSIVERHGKRRGLVSQPGIVGHQIRSVRDATYDLGADAVVVLHSDGVRERWNPSDYPGLFDRDPLVIATTLLRDEGVRRDDASVVVARGR